MLNPRHRESAMLESAIFLAVAVLFNVIVSLLFKQSSRAERSAGLMIIGALLLSVVNALCYTRSLAKIDLSIAYPIFAAGSITLICIASTWLFGETVSFRQTCGIILIMAGIALLCAR